MIKAVIFDFFEVLYIDGTDYLRELVSEDKRSELNNLIKNLSYGYISGSQFNEETSLIIGATVSDELISNILHHNYVKNDMLIDYIDTLANRYKIVVFSSLKKVCIESVLRGNNKENIFSEIFSTVDLGVSKNQPEAYIQLVNDLKLNENECIMIDDNISNIEAAKMSGMYGIVYENINKLKLDVTEIINA